MPDSLLSVLLGGGLALSGVLINSAVNILMKRVDSRTEEKKRRAAKFEELVETVYELAHWLDNKRHIVAFGNEGTVGISPMAKLEAISAVHFPNFGELITKLDGTVDLFEAWMYQAAQKRLTGDVDHMSDGVLDVADPYFKARLALLSALKSYARSEFL